MGTGEVALVADAVAAAVAGREAEGGGVVGKQVGREEGGVETVPTAALQRAVTVSVGGAEALG